VARDYVRRQRPHAPITSITPRSPTIRFSFPILRLCFCGSGHIRRELCDAHGIFCAFVCDACEARKSAVYDPKIFDAATYPADEPIDDD
jgi:hypothetical protein